MAKKINGRSHRKISVCLIALCLGILVMLYICNITTQYIPSPMRYVRQTARYVDSEIDFRQLNKPTNATVSYIRNKIRNNDTAHLAVSSKKNMMKPSTQTRQVKTLQILRGTDKVSHFVPVHLGVVRLGTSGLRCNITDDINWFDRSQVLLMNMGIIFESGNVSLPSRRLDGQRWVAYTRESPYHISPIATNYSFNHTMTYSPYADIPVPYGECHPLGSEKNYISQNGSMASGRRHLVAWFVSNCAGQSGRMLYVKQLQKYIPVHIYGKCGTYTCPQHDEACITLLRDNYKFYLSFENSLCHWYLTEKVFRAYEAEVVPVVMGALDYSEHLPNGSYLHVADYESPEALARHMMELNANDTLYNEMFNWRTKYRCGIGDVHLYTRKVCQFLHETDNIGNYATNFGEHWNRTTLCKKKAKYLQHLGVSLKKT